MAFIDGVEAESTIMHLSNTLPDIRIAVHKNVIEEKLLMTGRLLTLNMIQTKRGWMIAGSGLVLVLLVQLYFIGCKVLQKRRHLRALEEVKKL